MAPRLEGDAEEAREAAHVLVIGGEDRDDDLVSSMERYDPSTNAWEEEAVSPMPTARENARMAVTDDKLYVAGGVDMEGATSNLVERYDFATNSRAAALCSLPPLHN